MKKPIRVVLVDDNDLLRHRLQLVLELVEGVEIVGNYASAEESFSQMPRLFPDIVLMAAQMPGMGGIETTRHLKKNGIHCDTDVIILAESMDYLVAALEAGASACLTKDVKCARLIDTIRQVYQNKQSLEKHSDFVDKVELALSPLADAGQILEFTDHVKEMLHASVLKTVGSRDCGTAVTIGLKPTPLTNLLGDLMDMPEVEKVEEPLVRDGFPSFLKKIAPLLRARANSNKRIQVTLRETLMGGQRIATAVN